MDSTKIRFLRKTLPLAVVLLTGYFTPPRAQEISALIDPLHSFTEGLEEELAIGHAFGFAIALSEDGTKAAISTVPTNLVDVYQLTKGDWELTDTLTSGVEGGGFGSTLAFDATGSTLVIGEPYGQTDQGGTGLVHVYSHDADKWEKRQTLEGITSLSVSTFGLSLALSSDGTILLIGAPNTDKGSGAVFGFEFTRETFQQVAAITRSDIPLFGNQLALSRSGETSLIGGFPVAKDAAIPTVVYQRDVTTGGWESEDELLGAEVGEGSFTRNALALTEDGAFAAVGTPDKVGDGRQQGAVLLFESSSEGWREVAPLSVPEGTVGFGATVVFAQDDEVLLVSEWGSGSKLICH